MPGRRSAGEARRLGQEIGCLKPTTQAEANAQDFERVEEEVVGAGKHEEYHRLLEMLEKTYCQAPEARRIVGRL